MNKIIEIIDKEKNIKRITTVDERFYIREAKDKTTGLPIFEYIPSVTWIAGHYPKGVQFYKWLAENGWDESQAIKNAAGDKGSKVHAAIEDILDGKELKMNDK